MLSLAFIMQRSLLNARQLLQMATARLPGGPGKAVRNWFGAKLLVLSSQANSFCVHMHSFKKKKKIEPMLA